MIQTFTQNDLLRHLYTEESEDEANQVNVFLASEPEINEHVNDFKHILQAMNQTLLEPSSDSVNFVLEYSRITSPD